MNTFKEWFKSYLLINYNHGYSKLTFEIIRKKNEKYPEKNISKTEEVIDSYLSSFQLKLNILFSELQHTFYPSRKPSETKKIKLEKKNGIASLDDNLSTAKILKKTNFYTINVQGGRTYKCHNSIELFFNDKKKEIHKERKSPMTPRNKDDMDMLPNLTQIFEKAEFSNM